MQSEAAPQAESIGSRQSSKPRQLAARLEPFDSFWQSPDDVESGFKSFFEYYKYNYLPLMPKDRQQNVLVISCGPGYLLNVLRDSGYSNVVGIDSDPEKIEPGLRRGLNCKAATAFEYLTDHPETFDVIIPEQELNHLTTAETVEFLQLCRASLNDDGMLLVYGLNGANPLVASENLSHNIDHFNTFTEYSLQQLLELGGFRNIEVLPLKIYVFWKNPLNYVGLGVTTAFELFFRIMYKLYGKNVRTMSKKIAASCRK